MKLLKNATLYGYENKTLGEAVEGFFEDPTWEKITGTDGNTYVNVSGKILYGDLEVEVILQYLVESDGSFTFNLTGKKSPTSIGGAMNCPIVF